MKKIGVCICGILTLILITLKVTGYITWDWVLVIIPLWLPMLINLILVVLGEIAAKLFVLALAILTFILVKGFFL